VRYIRKKANPRVRKRSDKSSVAFWDMMLNHPSSKDLPNLHKKSVRRRIRKHVASASVVSTKDVTAFLFQPVRLKSRSTKNRPDPTNPGNKNPPDRFDP
jgi:hypothetical protein